MKRKMEKSTIVGITLPPAPAAASGNQQVLDSPPEGEPKGPFCLLRNAVPSELGGGARGSLFPRLELLGAVSSICMLNFKIKTGGGILIRQGF